MNRRTAILAGTLALVVLACAGLLLWQRASAQAGVSVRIYQYGELVEEVRLDQVTEPYTIPLSGEDGKPVAPYPVIKIGRMAGDCTGLDSAGDRQRLTLLPPF